MKYASEDLRNEHEGILLGMSILESMVGDLKTNRGVDGGDLGDMVDFLKLFADKCHHGKEEGFLFPAMEKYGIPKERGPIGQMLLEHEEGRRLIARMSKALEDKTPKKKEFAEAAEAYIELLRSHIEKENGVLFPMGDRMIPPEQQAELLRSFERHEEEAMGKGTHERLHGMLEAFRRKYPTKP